MDGPTPRRTALVTGASAGIGEAFAREYAARGLDLVITARRADRLGALAAGLERANGVTVLAIPADLTDPGALAGLAGRLEAAGRRVDVLVNNAGYAVTGSFRQSSWEVHAAFLQVMVSAYAEACHRFLPAMIERGWGRIINVSSLAGLVPGAPGQTLYAASKAFLIRFSQSLGLEVARHGVHVTALCPGYTRSEFHDVAGIRPLVNRLPSFMWMDAATVARQGVAASEAGRLVYTNGRVNQSIALLSRLLPESVVHGAIRRSASRLRRQGG
jgi:short-subunit dehydrogenase